jgi:hypothetical protein
MSGEKIVLVVKGLSHVPSKKNSKMMITRGPKGFPLKTPRLITKPEYQRWIERCIRNFVSQLSSLSQTGGAGMLMVPRVHSPMHWSNLFDDSVDWIPEWSIKVERVLEGMEGAIVILEML